MADNIPSLPGGAVPPKPPEGSKVQPKKETVRINLPPKPSAAPTIKLPTLPPGRANGGSAIVFSAADANCHTYRFQSRRRAGGSAAHRLRARPRPRPAPPSADWTKRWLWSPLL